MSGILRSSLVLVVAAISASGIAHARVLPIEERIEAQRAVERVWWRHRIWPAENTQPKPDFAMSPQSLRQRIANTAARRAALDAIWHRAVSRDAVQAELNRIAAESKDAVVLAELFAALNHDADLIGATLVEPILVERALRSAYARDPNLHAEVRRAASRAVATAATVQDLRRPIESWSEVELVIGEDAGVTSEEAGVPRIALEPDAWERRLAELDALGAKPSLQESDDAFFASAAVSRDPDRVRVVTASWSKRPFDAWWLEQRSRYAGSTEGPAFDPPLVLPAITATACTPDTWGLVRGFVAAPRSEHTAVWTGTEMIVWGGLDVQGGSGARNDGGRYAPATDSWRPLNVASAPDVRHLHTAVWSGTEMIVWGGRYPGVTNALASGGRYDPVSDSWNPMSVVGAPLGRNRHSAVWTGNEMIVWGGNDCYSTCGTDFNSGGRYTPTTNTWVPTSTVGAPAPRYVHSALWTGSRMLVWGGTAPSSGGQYDPSTNSWTAMSNANAPSGISAAAIWTGSQMIVWGGYDGSGHVTSSGGRYNPVADTWTPTSLAGAPEARSSPLGVWTGSLMLVWGGLSVNGSVKLVTGGRYSPATDSWTSTTTTGAPSGRRDTSAIWTGSELVVWGGDQRFSGGRYNPASDTWTPTATNAPGPRVVSGDIGAWTGTELVIWGGFTTDEPNQVVNSGSRYNPALDSWTPTSTLNVPAARHLHTAAWVGDRVLFWGGRLANNFPTDTGGGYRPADDTWAGMSTTGAPIARGEHTAIWTGSEMIVWGGRGSGSPFNLNSGGRYNPATGAWSPTGTSTAPSIRYGHRAVWADGQMIVWGGLDSSSLPICDGKRYNPVTDSWIALPTAMRPPACARHNAVWSGTEMIVWGGSTNPVGARYRPATDAWTRMSSVNAPSPPGGGHVALWTGNSMLVWGGDVVSPLDGGGLYSPSTDSWTRTTRQGPVPGRRFAAVGAWTGNEAIIWGGLWDGGTGGRYCACGELALPATVGALSAAKSGVNTQWGWTAPAGASSFEMVRGELATLQTTGGNFAAATTSCVAGGVPAPPIVEAQLPALGTGFWYLVRSSNCRGDSSYEDGSPSTVGARDAGIQASAGACP